MSNKDSDKNVVNVEDDVKILKHIKNDFDWDLQHPNSRSEGELQEAKKYSSAIEHILAEREKMLKERNVANDSVIAHRFAVMQQQINEKDKRIQELEEVDIANRKVIVEQCDYIQNNSIPKQVVIDKIEEINNNKPYLMKFNDWREKEYTNEDIIDNCVQVLQELLEGERK